MAIDNDLSALLPESPPPRPARREAAIEEALRRFDGRGPQTPPAPVKARPTWGRDGWGRPQIAALASVALVVLVSVPIWWAERDRLVPNAPEVAAPAARDAPVADAGHGLRAPPLSGAVDRATAHPEPAAPATVAAPAALPATPPLAASATPAPALARRQPPAAMAAEPTAAAPAAPESAIVVTGSRVARADFDSSSPVVSLNEEVLTQGDWNDCTLLDPNRDASACRAFADPAAGGATGRAAAQLADGLALAWQGDLDRAIDAFDRAIRAAPDLSVVYLNRGLAHHAKGNLRRALADLNRAVARDPDGARGYYHRSQLHRARGDTARADADAARAVALDPRYRAVLP